MAKSTSPSSHDSKKLKEKEVPPPPKPQLQSKPQPQAPRPVDQDLFSTEELEKFRVTLLEEKKKILHKAHEALKSGNIQLDKNEMYDEVDLASATIEQNLTFRLLDRDRKLLTEVEHALSKIDSGDFGFCEGTGEIIPKRRLELRPWTRHSVKYKEYLEKLKKAGRSMTAEEEEASEQET